MNDTKTFDFVTLLHQRLVRQCLNGPGHKGTKVKSKDTKKAFFVPLSFAFLRAFVPRAFYFVAAHAWLASSSSSTGRRAHE